jgi:hypothetical protein
MSITVTDLNKLLITQKVQDTNHKSQNSFPLTVKYYNRNPDPGVCFVMSINWGDRRMVVSNGTYTYLSSFDEVKFISKETKLNNRGESREGDVMSENNFHVGDIARPNDGSYSYAIKEGDVMSENNFHVGDIVRPNDGSYSYAIKNGKLVPSYGLNLTKRDFQIVSIGDRFPVNGTPLDSAPNDTMLRALDNNQTVFISSNQIVIRHRCDEADVPKCDKCDKCGKVY